MHCPLSMPRRRPAWRRGDGRGAPANGRGASRGNRVRPSRRLCDRPPSRTVQECVVRRRRRRKFTSCAPESASHASAQQSPI